MSQPELTIVQGKLRGSVATNVIGETYYRFQGIPYAKPPLGELRFKAPQPPEKWNGILDATKEGSPCYARDMLRRELIIGSENCLVLNVYTKKIPDDKDKNVRPVLFWIHGGAFTYGSGSTEVYGPDLLITEDVVVVTINYRLGMLGFLSLKDPSLGVTGNAGLKDMVMALKWVQKNIAKFGGDPHNVTIFGESAGGAAVHLLYLSEMSKGLFHKAIAQSGCALNPWVRGKQDIKGLAAAIGLDGADEKTVYKYLMERSVEEIHTIQEKLENPTPGDLRSFGVVIENKSEESAFLAEEPIRIMLSGKFNQVPFMTGYTTAEGMVFALLKDPNHPERPTFEEVIPWFFGYQNGSPERKAVAEKIKTFYYGSEEPSHKNIGKKYALLSDVTFIYGIYITIMSQFQTSKAPTYLYRMSIETTLNFFKQILKIKEPGSQEDTSYKRFVRLWTNFAKYGNPTPKDNDPLLNVVWKPVTGEEIDFLDIGENLVATSNPEPERINFWKNLFAESPAAKKTECAYVKSQI
ncbi:COesterase, Abhydrolase 3, and/or DUF2424 domain containing protein [Asbolus verrucosus]|uniref:Carboxylic ester hydrolase n=1 Tax=Asbolus verrucosus TaxID=1661398 RepID=A0A482VEX2_ASBVE|nr:COesterase, Abhydrolase 3, and/or DUF2424 domain containing protein [Asbolus verrucosus]